MNKFKVGDIVGVTGQARTRKVNRIERDTDYLLDDCKWYKKDRLVHPLKYKVGDKVNFDGKEYSVVGVIHGLSYPYFLSDGHWYCEKDLDPVYKELKDIPLDKLPGTTVYYKHVSGKRTVTHVTLGVKGATVKVNTFPEMDYGRFCEVYSIEEPLTPVKVGDTIGHTSPSCVLAIHEDWVWCRSIDGCFMTVTRHAAAEAKKAWKEKNK